MTGADPCYCRMRASECREHAERAISQFDKDNWLHLAGRWLRLAEASEELAPRTHTDRSIS